MLYPFWHTGGWSRTLIGAELYLSLSLGLLVWLMLRLRKAKAAAVTLA